MRAENPISIDLNEIHKAFGYVPHPQSFRDNPGNLVGLSMVVNGQIETSIGALDIVGVDIGYYDDYDEMVSTADDANITEESSFWVWIKDDAEAEAECVICGEPTYGEGIHEDLCEDCSQV